MNVKQRQRMQQHIVDDHCHAECRVRTVPKMLRCSMTPLGRPVVPEV